MGNQHAGAALRQASADGDLETVRRICQHHPQAATAAHPRTKATALHYAAYNGHLTIVEFLYGNGADIDATTSAGNTALHWAASNKKEAMMGLLLELGANPNVAGNNGNSPVAWTSYWGMAPLTKVLLERGADPNVPDLNKHAALHWAAIAGNTGICAMLLTHGADPTQRTSDGLTPLQLAMKHKRSSTIELLKSVQGRTSGISDAVAELAKRTGQAVGRRNETHGAAQVNPVAFLGTPADRARRASSGAHAAHKVRAESKSNAAGRSRSTSTSTSTGTSTGNKPPLPSASAAGGLSRRAAHEAGRSMFFAAVTPSRRTSGAGAPPAIPAPLGAVDVQDVMLSVVTPGGLGQRTAYQQKRAGGGFSEGKNATDPDDWFNAPPPATSTSTGAGQAAAMFNMTPSQIAARARKIARERARKAQASRRPTPTSTTAAFTLTPPPPAPSHRHKVAGGFRRG